MATDPRADAADRELREHHAEAARDLAAQAAHIRGLIDAHGRNGDCTCKLSGYRCVAQRLYDEFRRMPADSLAHLLASTILTRALAEGAGHGH